MEYQQQQQQQQQQQHLNQKPLMTTEPIGRNAPVSIKSAALRPAKRVPLGELSNGSNLPSGLPNQPRAAKVQAFTIYQDQVENVQPALVATGSTESSRLTDIQAGGNVPRKSAAVRPPFPSCKSEPAFTVYDDMCDTSAASQESFPLDHLQHIVKSGFRQHNDSILTDSPMSERENTDHAEEDDYEDEGTAVSDMVQQLPAIDLAAGAASVADVDEYSLDIVKHMLSVEKNYMPKWNYMTKQPDISYSMRCILVDWLVDVCEEYSLHSETLFLAVNYIDRFLSLMSVQRAKLQLVGTACLFIASKYEEIYPPDVSEFCYVTDDTYSKQQVLRMEHLILQVLNFECSPPTAHFYVNHFAKLSGCKDDSLPKSLAQYLAELTLLDAENFLHFLPSVVGAAAIALARHNLGMVAWDESMVSKTGYRIADLQECLVCLHEAFTKASDHPQQAVREKYAHKRYNMVSKLQPVAIS